MDWDREVAVKQPSSAGVAAPPITTTAGSGANAENNYYNERKTRAFAGDNLNTGAEPYHPQQQQQQQFKRPNINNNSSTPPATTPNQQPYDIQPPAALFPSSKRCSKTRRYRQTLITSSKPSATCRPKTSSLVSLPRVSSSPKQQRIPEMSTVSTRFYETRGTASNREDEDDIVEEREAEEERRTLATTVRT